MILAMGDIHRDFHSIAFYIEEHELKGNHIFVCGDCGLGFASIGEDLLLLRRISDFMIQTNNTLHLIRGNHDNPAYWEIDFSLPNIQFHRDGDIVEIEGKRILCIGGAVSTDVETAKRVEWEDWWRREETESFDILNMPKTIDYVISHDAPMECPVERSFKALDCAITIKANQNRGWLSDVYSQIKSTVKGWYHGHYHISYVSGVFHGLDIKEVKEIK